MRIAALDVGSNSFHLIVADVGTGGHINVLDRAKEMVRLGDSTLHHGVIPPEVFRRGLDALRALRRIADRHNVDALVAVATSAVREAQNGGEFVRAARDEAGIDIRVIRGDEEARLIYLGARGSLDLGKRRVALFDLGGGSLEVILADAQELYFTASLKLGRHPPGRDLPLLRSAHARASAPSWPSGCARCSIRSSRACAPWASTSSPSRRARRRRWPACCAPTRTRAAASRRSRCKDLGGAGAAAGHDVDRGARAAAGARRAARRHHLRGRGRVPHRAGAGGRGRGDAVRDRAARGDHRRLRRQQPPRHAAGRRVSRPAPPDRHGAGAPLPVPRGPRHARRPAGAVDLRPDAPAAQAGRGRRRAARVRGAAARHRLLHLAPPPPPPQRVPDPQSRDDRILARGGAHHRAGRAPPPQGRAEARARADAPAVEGRLPAGALPGRDPAHRRRARPDARAAGARGALLGLRRAPSRSASTPTAIPSWSSGRRAARAICSRSWPSASSASPSIRCASARSGPGAPSEATRPAAPARAAPRRGAGPRGEPPCASSSRNVDPATRRRDPGHRSGAPDAVTILPMRSLAACGGFGVAWSSSSFVRRRRLRRLRRTARSRRVLRGAAVRQCRPATASISGWPGSAQMRLYVNGAVALPPVTQGLASYYHRHALSFFTAMPPQGTTMAYALDTNETALDRALDGGVSRRRLQRRAGGDGVDPVLYNQVVTFVANFMLRPMVDFANTHSDVGAAMTNLIVVPQLERPGGDAARRARVRRWRAWRFHRRCWPSSPAPCPRRRQIWAGREPARQLHADDGPRQQRARRARGAIDPVLE